MAASGSAHPAGALLRRSVLAALLAALLGGCAAPGPSPTPALAAAFGVSDLVVAAGRTEVLSGDDVEVTARVENSGTLAGMLDVELSVDGVAEDRQGVSLDPGESTTVRFVIQAGPPGDHQIKLNAATATLRVTAAPAFQVSGLRLASTPAEILPGDELGYMVEVTNTGTAAGTYEAELSVDGTVASRQSVPLDVGQAKTLYFTVEAGAPGTHSVEVGPAGAILTVLAPASMAVTDLQLTQAGVPTTGEVAAVVTLENQGGAYGTLTVAVTVDGKVKETRPVTVAGGERKTVEIPLAVPAPGRHTVAVGGLEQDLVVWKISRPSNGTILVNKVKGGMGRLTIKNGDDERDVVLVLARSSAPAKAVLAVYVRATRSYTVKAIKDGRYIVYFTFGERWDSHSKAFTSSPDKARFEDTIRFRTTRTSTSIRYSIVTISLHQGGGDSAPTDSVDDEDFPTVP